MSAVDGPSDAAGTLVTLDTRRAIWDRFFTIAPLVLVGSINPDGSYNLAPKHLAMPLGWDNYYAFVCSPRHHTYRNIAATGQFTVSFPGPDRVVASSLAAAPRWDDDSKPSLLALPTFPATRVAGQLVVGCQVYLECMLERMLDGFGANSLIIGTVVAAQVAAAALRDMDRDDSDLVHQTPLLAYVSPGRFACVDHTQGFPFPAGFSR